MDSNQGEGKGTNQAVTMDSSANKANAFGCVKRDLEIEVGQVGETEVGGREGERMVAWTLNGQNLRKKKPHSWMVGKKTI